MNFKCIVFAFCTARSFARLLNLKQKLYSIGIVKMAEVVVVKHGHTLLVLSLHKENTTDLHHFALV